MRNPTQRFAKHGKRLSFAQLGSHRAGIEVMTTEQADAFEAQCDQTVTRTPIRLTVTYFITAGPRTNDPADVRQSFRLRSVQPVRWLVPPRH